MQIFNTGIFNTCIFCNNIFKTIASLLTIWKTSNNDLIVTNDGDYIVFNTEEF